jgi:hypothetical protein
VNAELVHRADAILLNLRMPVTRIGFGPLSFDPVEHLVGTKLSNLLEPLMTGPVFRRPSDAGPAVEVYPLALPEGEGASIPLGQFGEIGFKNERGLLVLMVPWGMASWLRQKFGDAIVRGPEEGRSLDGTAKVATVSVRLRVGMRASVALGAVGEIGLEAADQAQ